MHRAKIRIFYPLEKGTIVLRTEQNWNRDIKPVDIYKNINCYEFQISHKSYYLSFKPCIKDGSKLIWSKGMNKLAIMNELEPQDVYPYFYTSSGGTITEILEVPSQTYKGTRKVRLYLPSGYDENILKRYTVIYMHDGKNLFFPEEAFLGHDWKIDTNLSLLDRMNLIDQTIVAGIYAENREKEYTKPGYKYYGKFMSEELKPWIDKNYRTLTGKYDNFIIGSSLGGVVSFYIVWQWPEIFGCAACLSSTFSWKDDLIEQVEQEPLKDRKGLKLYLDSGWPGDNYEVTLKMATALMDRGFKMGRDFLYLAFPLASHSETAWSSRVHIPLQLFSGKLSRGITV